jgi:hypothetical protein
MSSVVKYNNECIAPVQTVSISREGNVLANGQCINPRFNIQLNGTLLANYGSPTSSGSFGCFSGNNCETIAPADWLDSLMAKQCALQGLFQDNYKKLEIGSSFAAYPRVASFAIDDTSNAQYFTYSINLEADNLYCDGSPIYSTSGCPGISSYDDSWDVNYDEEVTSYWGDNRLFRISHNCSAVGVGVRGTSGWIKTPFESARDWVKSKTGAYTGMENAPLIDGIVFSGGELRRSDNYPHTLYNYYETHSFDKVNNTYSISENWIAATGDFIESYTIDISDDSSSICPAVSIQGSIKGFEIRTSGVVAIDESKYAHANEQLRHLIAITGFHERCEDISGITLQVEPTSSTITKNPFTGEITYSYGFKKLPVKWLTGTKFEKITVSHNWGEDIYATLTILGKGEMIQPININAAGERTIGRLNKTSLTIDAVYPCKHIGQVSPSSGIGILGPRFVPGDTGQTYALDLRDVVNAYKQQIINEFDPDWIMVDSQSENYDRNDGSYQYSLSWTWQLPGVCGA